MTLIQFVLLALLASGIVITLAWTVIETKDLIHRVTDLEVARGQHAGNILQLLSWLDDPPTTRGAEMPLAGAETSPGYPDHHRPPERQHRASQRRSGALPPIHDVFIGHRPPTIMSDISDIEIAISQAGRPLTRDQIARTLELTSWEAADLISDRMRAGTIRQVHTHDMGAAYTTEEPTSA